MEEGSTPVPLYRIQVEEEARVRLLRSLRPGSAGPDDRHLDPGISSSTRRALNAQEIKKRYTKIEDPVATHRVWACHLGSTEGGAHV